MSLHKIKRSQYWYYAYRLANGQRTLRSTGETDRVRAVIKCQAKQAMVDEERRPDTDRKFFERIMNDAMRRLGHSPAAAAILGGDFLKRWLEEQRASVSSATFEKYSLVIREFIASLGTRATAKLATLDTRDIVRFRDRLLHSGRSPSTVNLMIRTILRMPFKLAFESGLIARNPAALVKPLKQRRVAKGVFTLEQMQRLLEAANEEWQGLVLFGWFTGGRLGDLSRLTWEQMDLAQETVGFVWLPRPDRLEASC